MSKEQDRFAKKTPAQPCADLLNALYQSLPAGPLTEEKLAHALAPYRPDRSEEELAEDCRAMLQGVQNGMADCLRARTLQTPEDINLFTRARLRESMMRCAPEERKSRLLLAVQDLHNRSGCPLNPEQCGILATFSEEELLRELTLLSRKCGDIGAHQLLSAMDAHHKEAQAHPQPSIIAARAQDFTTQEHLWIISAAAYASGEQPDMATDSPRDIGEQVGFIGRTLQMIQEFTNSKFGMDYAVPGLLAVCSTALAIYTAKHAMSWLFALEGQLASLSFLAADSIIPALVVDLSIYAGAFLWSCVIGVAVVSLMFLVVNACNDIQEHMERRKAHAAEIRQAVPVSAAPIPATETILQTENGYGLAQENEEETEAQH